MATAERNPGPRVLPGKPSHYLPALGPDDTVHVAGSPRLAGAILRKACAAGARCYADPFVSSLARPSRARLLASLLRVPQAPAAAGAMS
jgi:3-phenylpropionate/trans-cinnamate dioxygenase ferredoxin reductase subunit